MKSTLSVVGILAVVAIAVAIPFLVYGTIGYVIVHFLMKFW